MRNNDKIEWNVYRNDEYLGVVFAVEEEDAKVAALQRFEFSFDDNLSLSEK